MYDMTKERAAINAATTMAELQAIAIEMIGNDSICEGYSFDDARDALLDYCGLCEE